MTKNFPPYDSELPFGCTSRPCYCIELATLEKALFALDPIRRIVPTTKTRITASITAYSAISCPVSSDQILRMNSDMLCLQFPTSIPCNREELQSKHPSCRTVQGLSNVENRPSNGWKQAINEVYPQARAVCRSAPEVLQDILSPRLEQRPARVVQSFERQPDPPLRQEFIDCLARALPVSIVVKLNDAPRNNFVI